jgi:KDO2-lipid IV(A) lauroyltransferase
MPFGEDEKDAVRRSNDVLSEWIVSHPEQWMWLYPRWASTEAMISC